MALVSDSDTLTLTERRTQLSIDGTYGATLVESEVGIDLIDATPYGATLTESGEADTPTKSGTDAITLTESASVSSQGGVITASDAFTLTEGDNQTRQRDATTTDITLSEVVGIDSAFSDSDAGTLAEVVSIGEPPAYYVNESDTGTLAEAFTLDATTTGIAAADTDTGTLVESVTITITGITDAATLSEVVDVAAALVVTDALVLTETIDDAAPLPSVKSGVDAFTFSEGAVSISLSASDALTLVEASGFDVAFSGQAVGKVTILYRMAGTPTVY